jgi:hypothetical protein
MIMTGIDLMKFQLPNCCQPCTALMQCQCTSVACVMACCTCPCLFLMVAEKQRCVAAWGSDVAVFGVHGSSVCVVVVAYPTLCP